MKTNRFYYKNNIIQQLRGFYNVVQLGSITKAAQKMGLVQSAISIQIKSLQDNLGIKLLNNKNGKICLTPAGVSFYDKILPIIESTENLIKEFWQDCEKENQNILKLGIHGVVASNILPKHITTLLKEFPQSKITLSQISKEQIFDRIIRDELDLGIYPCSTHEKFPAEIETKSFLDYNICILVSKQNPLALKKDEEITVDEILENKILYEDETLMTSSKLMEVFKEDNINSVIQFENANWEIMKNFCFTGVGIAGFDQIYCKDMQNSEMVIKSISHLLPKMKYFFLTKKNSKLKNNVMLLKELIENDSELKI